MEQTETLVIGGGLSGLSVAWWLARAGATVDVWEQNVRPGGVIATRTTDGYVTERAASIMLNFRPEVTELIAHTELAREKLKPARGKRYVVHGGRLVAMPMTLGAFLCAPVWSMRGRLRLLAEPWICTHSHENETVSAFVTRRLGREVLEYAFEPFLAGALASDPERANAHAVLPRLIRLEQRYGSLLLGMCAHRLRHRRAPVHETFTFRGGMTRLIQALAAAPGVRLHTQRTVTRIEHDVGAWRVTARSPEAEHVLRARHLVLSVPAPVAAGLLCHGDAALGDLLRGIEYAPLAAVHLGFDRAAVTHPLDGMGFLAPRAAKLPITGCQWVSSLFPERAPPGKVLLTAYVGGPRLPQAVEWDEARITETVCATLKPLLGLRAPPEFVCLDRHVGALPLYYDAYPQRVRAIRQRVRRWPGLHLVANYLGGVSTRDCITSAYAAAQEIRAPAPHIEIALHRGAAHNVSAIAAARN